MSRFEGPGFPKWLGPQFALIALAIVELKNALIEIWAHFAGTTGFWDFIAHVGTVSGPLLIGTAVLLGYILSKIAEGIRWYARVRNLSMEPVHIELPGWARHLIIPFVMALLLSGCALAYELGKLDSTPREVCGLSSAANHQIECVLIRGSEFSQ
jgi:hypothetical protein